MEINDNGLQDIIISKLRMVDDLRAKLVHVKWGQESFILLLRIIQDCLQEISDQPGYEGLNALLKDIESLIHPPLHEGRLPQGEDRTRLMALLSTLQQKWSQRDGQSSSEFATPTLPSGEVILLAPSLQTQLEHKLTGSGFQVTVISKLDELYPHLLRSNARAILVDLDSVGDTHHCFTSIQHYRDRIGLIPPVFFLAERGDLAARLDAVLAGGAGYFTKPLNTSLLLDRLTERLMLGDGQGFRVLILNDKPQEAGTIARALEFRSITTQVITQPRRVIQAIHRFQPHLLILDLDLRDVQGTDLARVIHQHEACIGLSLVLLTDTERLSTHLQALGSDSGDLLLKPINSAHLAAAVTYRLRHGNHLYRKLHTLNQRDTATGLDNRRFFLDQLELRLGAHRPTGTAVLLISLDNLRALEASDVIAAEEVVEWAARRLQRVLQEQKLRAARFGDAMFAVLANSAEGNHLMEIARQIREVLETEVYDAGKDTVQIYTSIGISVAQEGERDVPTLLQQADLACNVARRRNGESIHIYHPQADRKLEASHEQRLLAEIQEAVEQQRMNLVYQPVVNLRGDRTERYEVLLRMRNQEGRELLPETVFTIARRQRRLGILLDRWVIAHAIRELRSRRGTEQQPVLFVNISPSILQDTDFSAWLGAGFKKTQVKPANLVLETSEATARKYLSQFQRFTERLQELGCGFSLDHFGEAQEASMELLEKLPVGYVKLDPSFSQDLVNNPQQQERLRTLVNHLADHAVLTIMGGIEDLPTLYALWSCGITYVQGYFLQRPQGEMSYDFEGKVH